MHNSDRDTLISMKSQKGFTLVEVIVVVAIVALLAGGIVFGSIQGFRNQATNDQVAAQAQAVSLSLSEYLLTCGQFPPQVSGGAAVPVSASVGCPPGVTLQDFFANVDEDLLDRVTYTPFARPGQVDECVGYHLSIELPDETSELLAVDHDIDSTSAPVGVVYCTTDGAPLEGSDGVDPWYDVVEPAALRQMF